MATLSWMSLPNAKVDRLMVQSGSHLTHFSSFAGKTAPVPVRSGLGRTRNRQNSGGAGHGRFADGAHQSFASYSSSVITMESDLDSMQWDDVADVVCAGTGVASLATAVVAADAGLEVFAADGDGDHGDGNLLLSAHDLPERLGVDSSDEETRSYLMEVSEGMDDLAGLPRRTALPVATLADVQSCSDRTVPPFVGHALRSWARSCLASPYGAVYTGIVGRNMSTIRTEDSGEIEAAVVGTLSPGDVDVPLGDFLAEQVKRRGITIHRSCPLQRLVFDEGGQVVGAVVSTADGARAVRARRGVVLASGGGVASTTPMSAQLGAVPGGKLCVMSRTASRFAQIGLLVDAASTGE